MDKTARPSYRSIDCHPGVLMDVRHDAKGDIDRESCFVRIVNGKAVVEQTFKPTWASN